MVRERLPESSRAAALGLYCSSRTTPSTFSRVFSRTLASLLTTRETVLIDTPARSATSKIVTFLRGVSGPGANFVPGFCGAGMAPILRDPAPASAMAPGIAGAAWTISQYPAGGRAEKAGERAYNDCGMHASPQRW